MEFEVIDRTSTLQREELRDNSPTVIVVHSTRSYPEFDDLLAFHKKRGFSGVGYHFFISASKKIYQARPIELEGAHALGFNQTSIGVCVYSKDGALDSKTRAMASGFIKSLRERNGNIKAISHTSAQLLYFNELLAADGITKSFDAFGGINEPERFEKMSALLKLFLGENKKLGDEAKALINGFKNCPGPMFSQLV
jgi:hypothetical protein